MSLGHFDLYAVKFCRKSRKNPSSLSELGTVLPNCYQYDIFAYLNVMAKQLIKTSDYRKVLLHGLKVNPTAFYVGVEVVE